MVVLRVLAWSRVTVAFLSVFVVDLVILRCIDDSIRSIVYYEVVECSIKLGHGRYCRRPGANDIQTTWRIDTDGSTISVSTNASRIDFPKLEPQCDWRNTSIINARLIDHGAATQGPCGDVDVCLPRSGVWDGAIWSHSAPLTQASIQPWLEAAQSKRYIKGFSNSHYGRRYPVLFAPVPAS